MDRAVFQGDFDFTISKGFILRVSGGIDPTDATATWLLEAIDPKTGEKIQSESSGLLRPGESGSVSYTVAPKIDVTTGDKISAPRAHRVQQPAALRAVSLDQTLDAAGARDRLDVQRLGVTDDYQVTLAGYRRRRRLRRQARHGVRRRGRRRLQDLAAPDHRDHRRVFRPRRAHLRVPGAGHRQRRQPREAAARRHGSRRRQPVDLGELPTSPTTRGYGHAAGAAPTPPENASSRRRRRACLDSARDATVRVRKRAGAVHLEAFATGIPPAAHSSARWPCSSCRTATCWSAAAPTAARSIASPKTAAR